MIRRFESGVAGCIFNSSYEYEVFCDKCSFSEEFEVDNWLDLLEKMKEKKWKSIKNQELDEWDNICPSCQEKEALDE